MEREIIKAARRWRWEEDKGERGGSSESEAEENDKEEGGCSRKWEEDEDEEE